MSDGNAASGAGGAAAGGKRGVLDLIERIGNALPEPAILFAILLGAVMLISAATTFLKWEVTPKLPKPVLVEKVDAEGQPVKGPDGKPKMVAKLGADGKPIVTMEPRKNPDGTPVVLTSRTILSTEGLYWLLSSMVRNFVTLPALGLVFVSMLGIGLAEKFGMFSALMRGLAIATPATLLTPVVVLIGACSAVASDAGYIVLPPLAAALYLAVGRHPIAGMAAAFAGVAGGFGGGLPNAGDGLLAGFATDAARVIDPGYAVSFDHNWYFKAASALVVTVAGWFVTDFIIEPRLKRTRPVQGGDTSAVQTMALTRAEVRGLGAAGVVFLLVMGLFFAMIVVPGAPLNQRGIPRLQNDLVLAQVPARVVSEEAFRAAPATQQLSREATVRDAAGNVVDPGYYVITPPATPRPLEAVGDRWGHAIVPLVFFAFLLPGMAYGVVTGSLRSQKDFIDALYHGVRSIVPVLVISFFMAQFLRSFEYTGLDRMLAFSGGALLAEASVPWPMLIVLWVLLVIAGDFVMAGMLSKFGVLAPIFIPMFMIVGISPEFTTAGYRIGDSVVNIVTPLNSYLLIILAVLQKYHKDAGVGSLIALMLPYSVVFGVVWTVFLILWATAGWPLGPSGPLWFTPGV